MSADGLHLWSRHLAEFERARTGLSFAVAERFLETPYLWGGRTSEGIDCSGLVQTALTAAGLAAPRDSDMMEAALGEPIAIDDPEAPLARGDLVFWKGHVGIMRDSLTLLHANGWHMKVVSEPLAEARERIAANGGGECDEREADGRRALTATELLSEPIQERRRLPRRSQVSDTLRRAHFGAEAPVSGRQVLMAARYDPVTRHRAAPQRTVLWPAFLVSEKTLDQPFCHSPVENGQSRIDVNQGVGCGQSFPCCGGVAVAVDDPGVLRQKIAVPLETIPRKGAARRPP